MFFATLPIKSHENQCLWAHGKKFLILVNNEILNF